MSLDLNKAEQSSAPRQDYGRMDDGTYPARIVSVVDIGKQHLKDWQNQKPQYHVLDDEGSWAKNGNEFVMTTEPNDAPNIKPQVFVTYEFPTERIEVKDESKPRWMSKEYVFSTHEKAGLTALIKAAAPGATDLSDLVGKPVFVVIGSTSSGNAKVTGVTAPMKGVEVGALENQSVHFDMDEPDLDSYNLLPAFVQKKIKAATNFPGSNLEELLENEPEKQTPAETVQANKDSFDNPEDFDDDIPF